MSIVKAKNAVTWPSEELWSDDWFDRAFRGLFRNYFAGGDQVDPFVDGRTKMIKVEEYVEDGHGVIRAELPGVDPEKDIEITVADGILHLAAQREERDEEKRPDGYRSEFRYGSYRRSVRLPEGVTSSDVKASYKDGILEVRISMPTNPPVSAASRIAIEKG
ncbi:Molecular chaperone IbpA, HSP20 family [Nakamurella panacisegetis]|uniref:Molecular chaperone IbpA, HSP20 family n=1 Tax=Nakamurella panacisegetis TaxID=1090615 RepID=A0A1H0S9U2_9ACTN|nr:Hsp20/alpha crystallin family protein [Nakamurella panacisegetis]SDP38437.1 Molecular chaperone IbpA, HSP20 family [Nakamurella panacisegetis]